MNRENWTLAHTMDWNYQEFTGKIVYCIMKTKFNIDSYFILVFLEIFDFDFTLKVTKEKFIYSKNFTFEKATLEVLDLLLVISLNKIL